MEANPETLFQEAKVQTPTCLVRRLLLLRKATTGFFPRSSSPGSASEALQHRVVFIVEPLNSLHFCITILLMAG